VVVEVEVAGAVWRAVAAAVHGAAAVDGAAVEDGPLAYAGRRVPPFGLTKLWRPRRRWQGEAF
jgi:hypothetical protein